MKCPECGRKFDAPDPGVPFVLGEHLNFMKTAPCPGSGRAFDNAIGTIARRLAAPDVDMAVLGLMAAYLSAPRRGRGR